MIKLLTNKKIVIAILAAISFLLLSLLFFKVMSKKESTQNTNQKQQADFKSIIPGQTDKQDVLKILGDPTDTGKNSNYDVLYFNSGIEERPNEIWIDNNKTSLIKEYINTNKTSLDITKVYGHATNILYRSQVSEGMALFIYPEDGIAYLGNSDGKSAISEIWYFIPTTMDEFKNQWASDYYENLPSLEELPEDFR